MPANALRQILSAARAQIRPAPEGVCRELRHVESQAAGVAAGDEMIRAIDEEQRPLFRREPVCPCAIQVREAAARRLDDIGNRDRPRARCAAHLHKRDLWAGTLPRTRGFVERGRTNPQSAVWRSFTWKRWWVRRAVRRVMPEERLRQKAREALR